MNVVEGEMKRQRGGGGGGEGRERDRERQTDREREGGELLLFVVCWLLNVPATSQCVSQTALFRQLSVLPH